MCRNVIPKSVANSHCYSYFYDAIAISFSRGTTTTVFRRVFDNRRQNQRALVRRYYNTFAVRFLFHVSPTSQNALLNVSSEFFTFQNYFFVYSYSFFCVQPQLYYIFTLISYEFFFFYKSSKLLNKTKWIIENKYITIQHALILLLLWKFFLREKLGNCAHA